MNRRPTPIQRVSSNGGSPALTIDNDSFSSIRPHVMGHPGARVHPPLRYTSPPPPDRHEPRSPLHKQLLLVATPNPIRAQSLVGRLSVVRPSSDDIIVVESKRSGTSADETPSVEAIYQVIGSSSNNIIDPRQSLRAREPEATVTVPPAAPVSVSDRPIAIPKSRLSKLRPAQRSLPTSRQVVEAGPVYTRNGSLRARRPESIILMAKEKEAEAKEVPAIEVTDSYCNDIGYDLASAEIDSLYCRSFDIDLLPEAPERKLSFYNIGGVKDLPAKKEAEEVEKAQPHHRTLGLPSTGSPFAKPNIREDNADFYIRMLTLRSSTNPAPADDVSPPPALSPAKTLPDP
ncbi:hypothetical protein GGI21_003780, partial [Coemansia aciculifera]